LGHKVGDSIRLSAAEFARLSEAFLAEIERKFVQRWTRPASIAPPQSPSLKRP